MGEDHESRKDVGGSHKRNGQKQGQTDRENDDRQTHHNAPTKIIIPKPKTLLFGFHLSLLSTLHV
jgi:hypothetical protein